MTPTPQTDQYKELREKLAAIEHKRWSDWMQYMFDCGVKSGDDNINVRVVGWPTDQYNRWLEQMETDYADLTEKEKDSDREQVDRYLQALIQYIERREVESRIDELQHLPLGRTSIGFNITNRLDNIDLDAIDNRINMLTNLKEGNHE